MLPVKQDENQPKKIMIYWIKHKRCNFQLFLKSIYPGVFFGKQVLFFHAVKLWKAFNVNPDKHAEFPVQIYGAAFIATAFYLATLR